MTAADRITAEIPVRTALPTRPLIRVPVRVWTGPLPDERAGRSLVHAVLVDGSRRWRGITVNPTDLETSNALRAKGAPLAASV
jgi:hypothetical protein